MMGRVNFYVQHNLAAFMKVQKLYRHCVHCGGRAGPVRAGLQRLWAQVQRRRRKRRTGQGEK